MYKMFFRVVAFWAIMVLFVPNTYAQVIGYQCSFEDSIENSLWDLNVGDQGESCVNKWYVGKAGAFTESIILNLRHTLWNVDVDEVVAITKTYVGSYLISILVDL